MTLSVRQRESRKETPYLFQIEGVIKNDYLLSKGTP